MSLDESESGSDKDFAPLLADTDFLNEQASLVTSIENGKSFLQDIRLDPESRWRLTDNDDHGNCKVKSPTCSKIPHATTHPALIRCTKEPLGGLDGFARIIKSDCDYEADLAAIMSKPNPRVRNLLNILNGLPEGVDEARVQAALMDLINGLALAMALQIGARMRISERMAVGGILADSRYDIHGRTDITVYNDDDVCLLAVEVKIRESFPDDKWYHDYRAT